ncbi:MAG: hypothetical protein AVDCRST_MAG10-1260 [uncultured Acidimicrobiales bacterium]|uniref:DUF7064 domain-containing protein n=1 Tax=uncultured Acidimicrobiales bacterium TaxID=310071 RepID=A0A6J4HWG1_9ACTN|nr:MAG: hypothetical protein AVDCRST_MAG10-1260 [uncultured Acidimicrobiales bacterium]
MVADQIPPADERPHRPGAGRHWEESWYLDFVAGDGRLAGYVKLTLRPGEGTAWFWAGMVGGGPTLVTVRDHEVPMPTGRGLEVRASGLWTELVCETPLDHWSVGLEAFGVALDDPLEAWGRERGDPWALGLDVEWEATAPCVAWPGPERGYWQGCNVHGDVLVGAERFSLDGSGTRIHLWGDRSAAEPSGWAAGRLDDGTVFSSTDVVVACDEAGRMRSLAFAAGEEEVTGVAVSQAPVLLPGAGRLARAVCRYETPGGRNGHGWAEWFVPAGLSAPP